MPSFRLQSPPRDITQGLWPKFGGVQLHINLSKQILVIDRSRSRSRWTTVVALASMDLLPDDNLVVKKHLDLDLDLSCGISLTFEFPE